MVSAHPLLTQALLTAAHAHAHAHTTTHTHASTLTGVGLILEVELGPRTNDVVVGEDVLVLATLLAELLAALLTALLAALLLLAVTLELSVKTLGAVLATDAVLDEGLERRRVAGFGAEQAVDGDDVN